MTDTPDKPDEGRTRSAALRAKFLRNTDPPSPERVAAFEREMMLERQREGIAAKRAGEYKGRAPTARASRRGTSASPKASARASSPPPRDAPPGALRLAADGGARRPFPSSRLPRRRVCEDRTIHDGLYDSLTGGIASRPRHHIIARLWSGPHRRH